MIKINREMKAAAAAAVIAGALLITAFVLGVFQPDLFSALEAGKRPSYARAKLEKMVAKDTNDLRAQGWLLRLEVEQGDTVKAEQRLGLLLVKAPDQYLTQSGGCRLYLNKNRNAESLKFCRRAWEFSNHDFRDANNYGVALIRAKNFTVAEEVLKKALATQSDNLLLLINLGHASMGLGKYDQAVRVLEQATKIAPKNITARRNLVQAYYLMKRTEDSARELKELIKLTPDDQISYYNLVIILAGDLHELPEAKKYLQLAVEKGLDEKLVEKLVAVIDAAEKSGPDQEPPRPGQDE